MSRFEVAMPLFLRRVAFLYKAVRRPFLVTVPFMPPTHRFEKKRSNNRKSNTSVDLKSSVLELPHDGTFVD